MSQGPIVLQIKDVEGKHAAFLPSADERAKSGVRLCWAGVSRAAGPTSPAVVYWVITVPDDVPPVYLKRGECVVFGQRIPGATVEAVRRRQVVQLCAHHEQ